MASQDPQLVLRGVGRRIAELRLRQKITQAEAAERLGVSVKYWQRLEAGSQNLSIVSLTRIATLLRSTPRDLLAPPRSRQVKRGRPRMTRATRLVTDS